MRPEPIPDQDIWPGAKLVMFTAPPNHDPALLEILPVSGLVDHAADGVDRIHIRIAVDAIDLAQLQARGWFWLVFYGGVTPFDVAHPEVEDLIDPD